MKKFVLLLLLICQSTHSSNAQSTFMSFNLRYDNAGDKENSWVNRRDELSSMILKYHPDVLGIQEGLYSQVTFLDSSLTDYNYAGVGRDDGDKKGEFSAVFFNTKKFSLLATKTYWLSPTPEKVSVGWDAAMERIVTFATLISLNHSDTIYVFNTHMDHIGKVAREKSAELIWSIIKTNNLAKNKLIVMGDFNSTPDESAAQLFLANMDCGFNSKNVNTSGPMGTFNAFNVADSVTKRIDYIFTKNMIVTDYQHINERRNNNLWLSDHLPVYCKVHF